MTPTSKVRGAPFHCGMRPDIDLEQAIGQAGASGHLTEEAIVAILTVAKCRSAMQAGEARGPAGPR